MNKSYSIGELMSLYYEREFSNTESADLQTLSAGHKRKLKKAFEIFDKKRNLYPNEHEAVTIIRPLRFHRKFIPIIIAIAFIAVAVGGIIVYISKSFGGTVYRDNTRIHVFDTDNSPSTIEKIYTLSVVPKEYELCDTLLTDSINTMTYKNSVGDELVFMQTVKSMFDPHINTEGYEIKETNVNGYDAIYVEFKRDNADSTLLVWNSKEYVLLLYSVFTKEESIDLAENNEKCGF